MRKYLLVLNGKAITDYFTKGRAEKAFYNKYQKIDSTTDTLELIEIKTGLVIKTTI